MYTRAIYKEVSPTQISEVPDPVASVKYDGGNFFMRIEPDGSPRFFSRRESVKGGFPERTNKLPHLTDTKVPELAGSIINVELIHTGHHKDNPESHPMVSGILNSLAPRALDSQKVHGPIRAVMFDVIEPKFETYKEKLDFLHRAERLFGKPDVLFKPSIKIGHKAIQDLIAETSAQGREGVIITSLSKPESSNTRIKVKHFSTYNLRVVGVTQEYDIKGSPKQSAGALVLADASGREVGKVGTGFTRDMRQQIFANPNSWIGRLVQVKAMPPVAHKLRHPVYNGEADGSLDTV